MSNTSTNTSSTSTNNLIRFTTLASQKGNAIYMSSYEFNGDRWQIRFTVHSGKSKIEFSAEGPLDEAVEEILREYDTVVVASDTRHFRPAIEAAPAAAAAPAPAAPPPSASPIDYSEALTGTIVDENGIPF